MQKSPRLLLSVAAVLFVGLVSPNKMALQKPSGIGFNYQVYLLFLPPLGIGAWMFTTKHVQVCEAENIDNQREEALQSYINKMLELLLVHDLRHSSDDDEVRSIARVRTITVLRKLDPVRKASVIQFLQGTDLLNQDKRIVELVGVDLSGANLSGVNLNGATLSKADLNKANPGWAILSGPARSRIFLGPSNLSGAKLSRVNLRGADLSEVKGVTGEQLLEAKSLENAIMPDGSKHP